MIKGMIIGKIIKVILYFESIEKILLKIIWIAPWANLLSKDITNSDVIYCILGANKRSKNEENVKDLKVYKKFEEELKK